MRIRLPSLLASIALPAMAGAAQAAPVTIAVTGPDGRPLAGAVVSIAAPGVAAPAPAPGGTYNVKQHDIQFQPQILIVPVGATVGFPNADKVRHHVYSFSKAKRFDLKLYGREDNRTVTFDRPGVVTLGCNIHDQMNGVLFVTDTPFAVQTDTGGRVRFANVPAGRVMLRVWHPSIRAPGNMLSQPGVVAAGGLSTTLTVRR